MNVDPGFNMNGSGAANGIASGGAATSPKAGNDRRKALLQLLMQKATGGLGGQAGSAVGSTPFGGMRAIPAHRDSQGQGFTHASQVAAQFVGGLGIGSRPGSPQGGSDGAPVQRFLPSDGGPVQRHTAAAPQAPPTAHGGDASGLVSGADLAAQYPNSPLAPQLDPNTQYRDMTGDIPQQPYGTPTTGSSNMIPLGNGAYFDPATGQLHYPNGNTAQ